MMRAAAGLGVVLACAVPAAASPAARAAANPVSTVGDWPTYHLDNTRDGYQTKLDPISAPAVQWTASLDGPVYGQPLLVGGRVLAATENDTVYALNRATGAVIWSVHLADPEPLSDLPCGDISPLGITSTMVYDPGTNRVYAVAETTGAAHILAGINIDTGTVEVKTPVEPPQGDPIAHQQRGALTLMDGRVYIPYGGMYGDCGSYIGQVVSVATDGTGPESYAVPTTREGGIWEPAGGVQDGDSLLYSAGNGAANTPAAAYDGSDSVIRLSPGLQRTDFFAPADWAAQNAADDDLASMAPALVGGYIYADGKSGTGYVLRPGNLGGIGGQVAELNDNCQAFGGSAVAGNTIYLPCTTGPRAVTIAADGTPAELWKSTVPAEGSPVIGGGAVWTVDYYGGDLYALDPATGATLAEVHIGAAPSFASPTLAGDQAFVGTKAGVVAVNGV